MVLVGSGASQGACIWHATHARMQPREGSDGLTWKRDAGIQHYPCTCGNRHNLFAYRGGREVSRKECNIHGDDDTVLTSTLSRHT